MGATVKCVKHRTLPIWTCLFVIGLLVSAPNVSASHSAASPSPRLVRADSAGLTLEWVAPPVRVESTDAGGLMVSARGYAQTLAPGGPYLPYATALIAVPDGASPRLETVSAEESTQALRAPLSLAPRPEGLVWGADGQPSGGDYVAATATPDAWPTTPVAFEEVGTMSGVRLARITFYPAIPDGGTLRITRRIRVEVAWEGRVQAGPPPSPSDPLTAAAQRAIINPWGVSATLQPVDATTRHTSVISPTAYIEVASTGIHEVTYADLEPLGFAGENPQTMRLFRDGEEIAFELVDDTDAVFEEGEGLRFYADYRFSRWTTVDVYRLVADSGPRQKTITERDATPGGLPTGVPWVEDIYEQNLIYTPNSFSGHLPAGRDGDRWVWQRMLYPDPDPEPPDLSSASFTFSTPAVDLSQDAELVLWLVGRTDVAADPDHRVDVSLNGTALGRVEWNGKTALTATLPITAGILGYGQNSLMLALPGIAGVVVDESWVDGFAVRYARSPLMADMWVEFESQTSARQAYTATLAGSATYRAYDITDPTHPQSLLFIEIEGKRIKVGDPPTGNPRRYLVTGAEGILSPARVRGPEDPWEYSGGAPPTGADMIIITHPDFAGEMDALVNLRQSQSISTTVVNVLGIYDEWGDGRSDPEAIRTFISDAYATWNPHPLYVLLVGDGSYDPKLYDVSSTETFIPPYLADVDPWAGETAADNRYVCVDGSDTLPDMLLGRLPVKSAAEAETVVTKIVAYETDPRKGEWNADVLLVADDPDSAGDFGNSSDTYAAVHVSDPFTVTRGYCAGASPDWSDCSPAETDSIHENLTSEWDQGALLIQFTGHSSWQQWATERFFHLDDVPDLGNTRRWPVVLGMTCFTGAFHRPEPTLDEALVTAEGGAIATWGPSGLGVGTGHDDLSDGFFGAVFDDEVETVGEAALAGKLELAASGLNEDLMDTFNLLGDPSLQFNRTIVPWGPVFLPMIQSGQ